MKQLSGRWGVNLFPGGGKCVWAEIDATSGEDDSSSPDDLLELWSDEPWPAEVEVEVEVDVEINIDVQAMLDSRGHTDDLVRDLQLTLLDGADSKRATAAPGAVADLARRLVAANEDFREARRPAGRMAGHDRSVTSPAALPAEVEPAVFDAQRLAAVQRTGLLDSAATESFDSLTCLAARLLHAPMAFLTLVDDRRSFWLSTDGVAEGRENPVEESFCQYVIADGAALVIGDATVDTRVCNNPSVGLLGVRAWAGFPVYDADGVPLGSFCVMDTVVRAWTKQDVHVLSVLSQAASAQIALLAAVGAELRAREDLEAVRASEQQAEQRLQRLASVTLELVAADTVEGLTEIVIDHALPVLGVDGGGVVLRESDRMRVVVSGRSTPESN